MSENKFSVPVKTPLEKKPTVKKNSSTTTQKKTETKTATAGTKAKTNTNNKKVSSSTTTVKKTGTVKKDNAPLLSSIPDMSLLSAKERHDLILGKKTEKKEEKKCEKKSERTVKLETIKSVQKKEKANVELPKIGERKAPSPSFIVPLLWILIAVAVFSFLTVVLLVAKKEKAETIVPSSYSVVQQDATDLVLNIEPGMTAFQVATQLSPIFDEELFLKELTERGLDSFLQVGKYKISSNNTIEEIINAVTAKKSFITVYDGQDIKSLDVMLANKKLINEGDFIKATERVVSEMGLPFAEGWFLSGSYEAKKSDCAYNLAVDMNNALLSYIKTHSSAFNESIYSISQLLIIASMVQRETQDESQMPLIASVIFNRLELDMPLGIDATTRYELNDWKNELKQSVLDKDTPYNTRRKKGLPPTGIGFVSEKALNAVLNPASTEYLYYRHGKDGKLYLSSTYQEHLALEAVAKSE